MTGRGLAGGSGAVRGGERLAWYPAVQRDRAALARVATGVGEPQRAVGGYPDVLQVHGLHAARPQRGLRIVAERADGWNQTGDPSTFVAKRDALLRHCEAVGRDPAEIEISAQSFLRDGNYDGCLEVANNWVAGNPGGVILRFKVPRTAAISVPAYGINVHSEHEVVMAGTAWKGWDVWAKKAPTLDSVPLQQAA